MTKVKNLPRRAQKAFWAKVGGSYKRIKKGFKPRSRDKRVTIKRVARKHLRRTKMSQTTDMSRTARYVLDPHSNMLHVWMRNPELVDVKGIDTKGSTISGIKEKIKRAIRREQEATKKLIKEIKEKERKIEEERKKKKPDRAKIEREEREIKGKVRSGLRHRMKTYFAIDRYKKRMAKQIANKGPMTYLEVVHLMKLAPREYNVSSDTVDWYAEIDPTLSYGENKAHLEDLIEKRTSRDVENLSKREVELMEEKYEDQWRDYVQRYHPVGTPLG